MAEEGWYIKNQAISSSDTAGAYVPAGGTHGYDNILMSMHTLFAAGGPDFQNGIISEPFENIHLYPMIAHILDIEPNPEIDGKIDNIRHLLK